MARRDASEDRRSARKASPLRRRMMIGTGIAGAALAVPAVGVGRLRQSDEIRAAIVGINGRGAGPSNQAQGVKGVRIAAMCDVDTSVLGRRAAEFEQRYGYAPAQHQDYRELLKDKEIDAVVIATPNHLHALYTIWACQAGKDVYVEKPVSHNIWEGGQMVKAARLHYDWHWQRDTGNGDLGNQGVHQMDIGRWALGEEALPPSVISLGGRLGYDDDGDTPNTMFTMFHYAKAPMFFEVRGLPRNKEGQEEWSKSMDRRLGMAVGTALHTEGGHVAANERAYGVASHSRRG